MILGTPQGDEAIALVSRQPDGYHGFRSPAIDTMTGRAVTPGAALGIGAFYSGANLIAKTGGTLPLRVYERTPDASQLVDPVRAQIAMRLRHSPNPDVSAATFWTTVFLHLVTQGNAYLPKVYEAGQFAPHMYLLPPDCVQPFRGADGEKLYRVRMPQSGKEYVLTSRALLHIPGISFGDGLMGHSPVSVMRHRLGVNLAASEHQQRFFANGGAIRGVLSVDGTLTTEAAETIRDQWQATYGGLDNAWKTAVLDHGAKYQTVSMSNEDAQFIDMMKLCATEIAAMLNIPPAMIGADGASMTYANAQQNDLHFLKFTLRPWLRFVETAINNDPDLFGPQSRWEPAFDVDDLIAPDIETRYRVYKTAREIGVLGRDEIRRDEDRAPLTDEQKADPDFAPLAATKTKPQEDKADAPEQQPAA